VWERKRLQSLYPPARERREPTPLSTVEGKVRKRSKEKKRGENDQSFPKLRGKSTKYLLKRTIGKKNRLRPKKERGERLFLLSSKKGVVYRFSQLKR